MGWWKHLGSSFDIRERLRKKIRGVKWVNCAYIHDRLTSPSGICARVSVCLRKIIKRLKWTAASFFSSFPFLFSFSPAFDLRWKKKKEKGNWWLARWFTTGRAALFTPNGKRSESGRIYTYTVIGVQSQPTKCCDDFLIFPLFFSLL